MPSHPPRPLEEQLHLLQAELAAERLARQRAETTLETVRAEAERNQALVTTAVEAAKVGLWELDFLQGRFLWWSDQLVELLGVSDWQDLTAQDMPRFIHPDDHARMAELFATAHDPAGDGVLEADTRWVRPDGQVIWMYSRGEVLFEDTPAGRRSALFRGAVLDITERKRIEETLRESEEQYRTLFESIDEGFCVIEIIFDDSGTPVDYRFLEVNPAFEAQTGWRDAAGKCVRELVPLHETYWFEIYGSVAVTGEPKRFTNEASQLGRWYDVYAFQSGEPGDHHVAVLFTDITQHKQVEEALRESEARLRLVADLVPDLIWSQDLQGSVDWCNQRWLNYTGQTLEECQGSGWLDVFHPAERDTFAGSVRESITAGQPLREEHRLRSANGDYRWFLIETVPVRDEAGSISQSFGAATDVHQERVSRESLQEQVTVATMELRSLSRRLLEVQEAERQRLARELHDEIGQTLTGMNLTLEMARRTGDDSHLDRAAEINDTLLAQVRALSLDLRPPVLDHLGLLPALLTLTEQYTSQTSVRVHLHHEGLSRRRFPQEIETAAYRVVQEALTNIARHAGTGAATVYLVADQVLTIRVGDLGRGFDVDAALARETSSGLAGIRERVKLLGGYVEIESAPGEGTTVVVELPLE